MKKFLFLALCFILSTVIVPKTKAQDSLIFKTNKVLFYHSGTGKYSTFVPERISYQYKFQNRYAIKLDNTVVFDDDISSLRFVGASSVNQKIALLDTKVDAYSLSTPEFKYIQSTSHFIPAGTVKYLEIAPTGTGKFRLRVGSDSATNISTTKIINGYGKYITKDIRITTLDTNKVHLNKLL